MTKHLQRLESGIMTIHPAYSILTREYELKKENIEMIEFSFSVSLAEKFHSLCNIKNSTNNAKERSAPVRTTGSKIGPC